MNTNHVAFVWRFIAKLFKTKTDLILFFMFIYFFLCFLGWWHHWVQSRTSV